MAIVNPQLMVGWDTNDTNSVAPDPTIISNGYPFQGIPASSEHNYIFGNVLDNLNFLKESGLYRWDPTITYKKQAMIARDEFVYFSLTDGNTGNDPLVSPSSWIDWVSLSNASWKTTGVTNAGSISTILATPYFGTASTPSDGDALSIRITTGEITFPSNVKINIDGSDYTLVGTVPFSGADSTLRILDVYFDGTSFYQKIPAATTSQAGIVQLSSSTSSTSEVIAATSKAVKDAKDLSLLKAQNLNDLADKPTARTNLGVYSQSEVDGKITEEGSNTYGSYVKFPDGTLMMNVVINDSGIIGSASSVSSIATLPHALYSTTNVSVTFHQNSSGNFFVIPSIAYANSTNQITLVLGNTTGSTRNWAVDNAFVIGRWKA
jgi:hypothetical protein